MRLSNWFLNILLFFFFSSPLVCLSLLGARSVSAVYFTPKQRCHKLEVMKSPLGEPSQRNSGRVFFSSRAARLVEGKALTVRHNQQFETLRGTTP